MFFNTWFALLRVVVVGTCAYIALVVLLRISGKRTLSKLNAFDLVVTVALGSTLATVLLSRDVALAEGVAAFALLAGLQFVVAWLSVRVDFIRRIVSAEPTMLFYRGDFLPEAMRRARVTKDEVLTAIRESGEGSTRPVEAVVLESAGTLSVVVSSSEHASSLGEAMDTLPTIREPAP